MVYERIKFLLSETFRPWLIVMKDFPKITTLHGFKFIADSEKNWIERLFWVAAVVLSWSGAVLVISAQWEAYINNPISFVVETTYTDWDTDFPSVVVCENDNTKRIEDVSDDLWGPEHDFNLEEVIKELAYFRGITYYTYQFCKKGDSLPGCIMTNITYYANMVRSKCEETILNCSWRGESFPCCEFFKPMDTELGTCYAINTIQGRTEEGSKLSMISNKVTGPGSIRFNVAVPANVYVLNEEEVPSINTLGSDIIPVVPEVYTSDTGFVFNEIRRDITLKKIENDAAARHISPDKRKCRYVDENYLDVYKYYSYSACTVQCRKKAQLRLCNCTSFFMPNTSEHLKCDVTGLVCLNDHLQELTVLKARWSKSPGLFCDCLPSCTEAEISVVQDLPVVTGEEVATVVISLAILPSERYRRNVVRGTLDLVVSVGGTCGLFLGASLLSFVELLHLIFIRAIFNSVSDTHSKNDFWHYKFSKQAMQTKRFKHRPNWTYDKRKKRNSFRKQQ